MGYFDDQLVISDLGVHRVYISSMTGEAIGEFGQMGTQPGMFREPSGVTVDAEGYMLVADAGNHRIQLYSPDGGFLCPLVLSSPIERPSDIHLTADGHLMVNNLRKHSVSIFKLMSLDEGMVEGKTS
jgi:sugar lactone lactonase YvrE